MRIGDAVVVLTADAALRIQTASAPWGGLSLAFNEADSMIGIVGASERDGPLYKTARDTLKGHVLAHVDTSDGAGLWYRANPDLHAAHTWLTRIDGGLPLTTFVELVQGWRQPPRDGATVVLTHAPGENDEWAAWAVTTAHAAPQKITLLRAPADDPLTSLAPAWPTQDLKQTRITVVGLGSIGSAVAHALAMYGVGTLTLVDDDRLLGHNLVRHQSKRRDVGRFKVEAVAEELRSRWPGTDIEALRSNVITNADEMRPLFDASSVIVCAADGVAPRRVVSHLARRAARPAVLACVLLDGAVGEILRLRPWPGHGCLLCVRAKLVDEGSLDPEPLLDRQYGTGDRHLPMTAVGSDLVLVGQLAAKVAVATSLEAAGHYDQVIAREQAVVGLRTKVGVPPPFDVTAGEVRWLAMVPDRPDCPTCSR